MNRLQALETDESFFVTLNPIREPQANANTTNLFILIPTLIRRPLLHSANFGRFRAAVGHGSAEVILAMASTRMLCNRALQWLSSWEGSRALGG